MVRRRDVKPVRGGGEEGEGEGGGNVSLDPFPFQAK